MCIQRMGWDSTITELANFLIYKMQDLEVESSVYLEDFFLLLVQVMKIKI